MNYKDLLFEQCNRINELLSTKIEYPESASEPNIVIKNQEILLSNAIMDSVNTLELLLSQRIDNEYLQKLKSLAQKKKNHKKYAKEKFKLLLELMDRLKLLEVEE
jgi:hypothetical protein